MNIFKLSYRNMISRPLNTALCLILLTLAVGMISLLLQINHHIQQQMENNVRGIDMVVGAKGSPLQMILSAVYHIDVPTGNISLEEAEDLQKNPLIASSIPLSYGDTYEGYRIVGTNHDYPELFNASLAKGRFWQQPFEVTAGALAAQNLELKIGDTFVGSHGLVEGGEAHADHAYRVVGILGHTNSVLDQLLVTATESVWEVHHHHHDHDDETENHLETTNSHHEGSHDENHTDKKEITVMLVKFRNPLGVVRLPRLVNESTSMQAAVPAYEINRLFGLMGVGIDTLSTIAEIIMVVSGLSIFISLYNALKDRLYEMALMRSYGSTHWQLVWMVLQEGLLLTLGGFLLGVLFSRIGLLLISGMMEANYHYSFAGWIWLSKEWWLLANALLIGLLASILPAIRVFNINISKTLANA